MAVDSLYSSGRQKFLEGSIAWLTDTIKVAMIKTAYTPNLTGHVFYSDISANTTGTPASLTSKTSTNGVAGAGSPVALGTLTNGDILGYLAIYKDTGVSSGSPLIALLTGKITVTLAASAATSNTLIIVESLKADLPSGTTLLFSGGVTATLAQAHSTGDRILSVNALSGPIAIGSTAEGAYASNLPLTGNGSTVSYTITSNIFTL